MSDLCNADPPPDLAVEPCPLGAGHDEPHVWWHQGYESKEALWNVYFRREETAELLLHVRTAGTDPLDQEEAAKVYAFFDAAGRVRPVEPDTTDEGGESAPKRTSDDLDPAEVEAEEQARRDHDDVPLPPPAT